MSINFSAMRPYSPQKYSNQSLPANHFGSLQKSGNDSYTRTKPAVLFGTKVNEQRKTKIFAEYLQKIQDNVPQSSEAPEKYNLIGKLSPNLIEELKFKNENTEQEMTQAVEQLLREKIAKQDKSPYVGLLVSYPSKFRPALPRTLVQENLRILNERSDVPPPQGTIPVAPMDKNIIAPFLVGDKKEKILFLITQDKQDGINALEMAERWNGDASANASAKFLSHLRDFTQVKTLEYHYPEGYQQ